MDVGTMPNHVKNPSFRSLPLSIFHFIFSIVIRFRFSTWYQSHSRTHVHWSFGQFFSHYLFHTKIKSIHSLFFFCHFCFRTFVKKKKKPVKSSLCNWPPRSRSGIYIHQITNQIPSFSRSNATCSNTTKIDPIQRWTRRHAPFYFSVV